MRIFRVPDSSRKPARNQSEAEKRFTTAMNQNLGLLTRSSQWRAARTSPDLWTLLLEPQDPVPLPRRVGSTLYLSAYIRFGFETDRRDSHEGGVKAVVREYIYSLRTAPEEEAEFLAWHWHPKTQRAEHPHVHARADHPEIPDFRDLHLPTARVFFEEVLLFTVTNLDASCREGGADSLRESSQRTSKWASWR